MPVNAPPKTIDSVQIYVYAIVDDAVEWTGRSGGPTVYVGAKLLERVPRLAIGLNYDGREFILLYCDEGWEALAAGGYPSLERAKERAEREYRGVASRWIAVS